MIHADIWPRDHHYRYARCSRRLTPRVLWTLSYVALALFLLGIFECELRWQVYALTGFIILCLASINPRRFLFVVFIISISINVHYWITQPLPLSYFGNTSPTALSIPLPVFLAALLLGYQVLLRAQGGACFRWGRPVALPAGLFICATTLSMLLSSVSMYGLFSLVELLHFFCIFLTTINMLRSQQDLELALKTLMVVLVFQCLVFFLQTVLGVSLTPTGQIVHSGLRASGTVGTVPSGFATFMEPLVFIALALFRTGNCGALSRWGGPLALMGLIAIALTLNRSSWSGIVLGFIVFELLSGRTGSAARRLTQFLLTSIMLALILVAILPVLKPRLKENTSDLDSRFALMRPAMNMIMANPIVGTGPGAYPFTVSKYLTGFSGWFYFVHNEYLLIWAERGTLGLVAWLLWLAAGIRQAHRARQRLPQPLRAFALGCLTSFIVLLWELFWNSYEPFSVTALIWLLFGMLFAANSLGCEANFPRRHGMLRDRPIPARSTPPRQRYTC